MKKFQPFTLLLIFSMCSCTTVMDIIEILAYEEPQCIAYRFDGCQIGEANCYEECEALLSYDQDYCICANSN